MVFGQIPVLLLKKVKKQGSARTVLKKTGVEPEVNKYHLICTPVFKSFKPPSGQSEAGRMGWEAVPARMCHGKITY